MPFSRGSSDPGSKSGSPMLQTDSYHLSHRETRNERKLSEVQGPGDEQFVPREERSSSCKRLV